MKLRLPQVQVTTICEMLGSNPQETGFKSAENLFNTQPDLINAAVQLSEKVNIIDFVSGMAFVCQALELELSKLQ